MTSPFTTTAHRGAPNAAAHKSHQQNYTQGQGHAGYTQGYGGGQYYPPPQQPMGPPPDGHEIWFMETNSSNRMLLSLRSGVPIDTDWSLERLLALTKDYADSLTFNSLPGLSDALFELAEWLLKEGQDSSPWFSPSPEVAWRRRNSLEALLVLRNASLQEYNMRHLEKHPKTFPLILSALETLGPTGTDSEYLLYAIEIFQSLAGRYHLRSSSSPILQALIAVTHSPDGTLVQASLNALTALFGNNHNSQHIEAYSPAFENALRLLPLKGDNSLLLSALDYTHAHLSHPPITRAFFLHPQLSGTVRILINIILSTQTSVVVPTAQPAAPASPTTESTALHVLPPEELARLMPMKEPQRSMQWMLQMFIPSATSSLTQVSFWTMYRETFASGLTASELIKNVGRSFPSALPMAMPGNLYVIKGIRRREDGELGRWACRWTRGHCIQAGPGREPTGPQELWTHLEVQHLGVEAVDKARGGDVDEGPDGAAEGADTKADEGSKMDVDGSGDVNKDAASKEESKPVPNGIVLPATNGVQKHDDCTESDTAAPSSDPIEPTDEPVDAVIETPPDHISDPSGPQECQWLTCGYRAPNLVALRRHALTHVPSLKAGLSRPIRSLPSKAAVLSPPLPAEPPSPVTMAALLIIRLLFREAYPLDSKDPSKDGQDRIGFPFAMLSHQEEAVDESSLDGEKRVRRVFRSLLDKFFQLRVGPEKDTITDWVGEMASTIMADCGELA